MSLKAFHLIFVMIVIMGADLFGGWAIHEFRTDGDQLTLWMGIVSMVGGLGLAGYLIWFIEKIRLAHLE
ncbi:MAG: hypothetical protein KF841_01420 [Phycisphaerae bacterium]|nr:hypothetical protein [Phycisphaerae bacterium]